MSSTASGFGWLAPQARPAGWRVARIHSGATIGRPPGWRPMRTDAGTVSLALFHRRRHLIGYLNLTPRGEGEQTRTWAAFRVRHNAGEGDHDVRRLAAVTGLRFHGARGACVRDSYMTTIDARYVEIACLITHGDGGVVVVAAAPPTDWARVSPVLERAIDTVTT